MLTSVLLTILASCASALRSLPAYECEVQLRTEAGVACGRVRVAERVHKYASFRGLPYGAPPLGRRRFAELEPVEPWEYLLDATEDGPACPQKDILYGRMTLQPRAQSEDCIYLNLHVPYEHYSINVPLRDKSQGLPIVVMIHGGGWFCGSGLTDVHGPEYLMATERVIVISINYRLNVFGFLSLGTAEVPGNQGLRDVLCALRWVQRHARAFGGDPDNVTIMGQSAGASIAHLLSISRAADGLFHKIFLMSGYAMPIFYASNPEYSMKAADDFIQKLGINSSDLGIIYETLTKMPLEEIMLANSLLQYDNGLTTFVPVEEQFFPGVERVLEASPLKLIGKGWGTQYPMLFGFTSHEREFFRWLAYVWQIPQRLKNAPKGSLPARIGINFPEKAEAFGNITVERCFHGDYSVDNYINCFQYLTFAYPMFKIAEWRGLGGAPAYMYKFSYESQRSIIKEGLWTTYKGAAHVEDLTYIFRTNSLMGDYVSFPTKNDDDRMRLHWVTIVTNFAWCGNPTCLADETPWPAVSGDRLQYQDISTPLVYRMKDLDAAEADWLRFLDSVDEEVRNVSNELRYYV